MSSPLDIVAIGFLDDNETALFFSSFWYSLALILRMVPLYALHGLHLGTIEDNAFKHKKYTANYCRLHRYLPLYMQRPRISQC